MYGVTNEDVGTFIACLTAGDVDRAVGYTMELFEAGITVDALLTGLLAPAQREAGRRWETGDWTVAQEHQATAVVDACLSALGTTEPRTQRPETDWVVVASVEGEWHVCPARMIAESLRSHGWRVRFLGASVSAERLRAVVAEGPRAVLLSCSTTAALPGAARCLDALADSGVRVIVGGAAFGDDPSRAVRLGACWAPEPIDAVALVDLPPGERLLPRPRVPEFERLDVERSDVACEVFDSLLLACPMLAACSEQEMSDIRKNAEQLVGALVAAQLLQDDRVFVDFVRWIDAVMPAQPGYHPSGREMTDALQEVVSRRMVVPASAFDAVRAGNEARVGAPDSSPLYDAIHNNPGRRTPMDNDESFGRPTNRLGDAAAAIRARAQQASARATAPATASGGGDALSRLRLQAERMLHGTPATGDAADAPALGNEPRVRVLPSARLESATHERGDSARAAQMLDAARAQAARLLDEAEREATSIRAAAHGEAAAIIEEAHAGAAEVLDHAEAEAVEWLAEAGRQVVGHLDEVEAEAARILATARAEAARVTAEASRVHADMTAAAAEAVQHAQQEAERQLTQAATAANAVVAKARSEAAAITAEAQEQRTRLADEAERLAAQAAELLEARLNEAEAARVEANEIRAAADAAIEADTRRLLGEAQADCDRILAEAQAEAERILAAAHTGGSDALDLRNEQASPTSNVAVTGPTVADGKETFRRRRFRP
ncbi:MAG TPA: cobalamin-dependent protein [Acidimicrobiales bacterium]|nr:cobalamin-dependent protein [Acidimicrobiales bacterium]